MQLIQSLVWLLAGIGVFIVGMNHMSDALEKSAGSSMKKLLEKISNNRFSGIGIGAAVTAIIQSSSATSVMVIGLVNAGVMTLMQATPIIIGANIGTTITGVLVALKNDYFNMAMYLLAFAGVMMGFAKRERIKVIGSLCSGLGLIFVGLNIMSSEQAFGNPVVEDFFAGIFARIDVPILLILLGVIFTALMQSSSASTGIVITMVGAGILELDLALFIILGANIGTCVTALLASVGANANSKRVALIHFTFNCIGTAVFTVVLLIAKEPVINMLTSIFPGDDAMSLQMRVSFFHVVFNVVTTILILPFVKQLVQFSRLVIKDKEQSAQLALKYVDERLISTPYVALSQVKKEIEYMFDLVEESITIAFESIYSRSDKYSAKIEENERIIDFTNDALTQFLIKLSPSLEESSENVVGSYFHVLNDLERIGDHADNFNEIGVEMMGSGLSFSPVAKEEIETMRDNVMQMLAIAKDAFENENREQLSRLSELEDGADNMKKALISSHFSRLADGNCHVDVSPYFSSLVSGLERVADHLVNIGYSIVNPTGSQE